MGVLCSNVMLIATGINPAKDPWGPYTVEFQVGLLIFFLVHGELGNHCMMVLMMVFVLQSLMQCEHNLCALMY